MTSQPMTVEQMADALFAKMWLAGFLNLKVAEQWTSDEAAYRTAWEIAVRVVAERERLAHAPRGNANGEGGTK